MECEKQYLRFEEYKKLGGSLDQVPFNLFELEARKNIDRYTFGRLKNLEEQRPEVKGCMMKLVNILESYSKFENLNKGVSSENIDGYSVSYGNVEATSSIINAKKSEIYSIIKEYLSDSRLEDGTPYLYRGVKC